MQGGYGPDRRNDVRVTDIHALPLDSGPGVSAAVELKLFEAPVGVVSVSVALATSDLALPGHAGGGS